jgi:hypothetical protein
MDNNDKNNKYDNDNSSKSTVTFKEFSDSNISTQIHTDIDPIPYFKERGGAQGVIIDENIKNITLDNVDKHLQPKKPITKGNKNSMGTQIHTDIDPFPCFKESIFIQRTEMDNLMVKKYVALEEYFGSNKNYENKLDEDDIKDDDMGDLDMSDNIYSHKSYRNDVKRFFSNRVDPMDGVISGEVTGVSGLEDKGNILKKEEINLIRKEKESKTNENEREFSSITEKNEDSFIIDSSWLQKLSMASPLK